MLISRLTLKNFCQHEHLDAELGEGLVGILGPNGSGKSGLLDAIRVALLGRSEADGPLAENIRWGSDSAAIGLTFAHGDAEYQMRCSITASGMSRKLVRPSGRDLVKKADIDAFMEKLLGSPLKSLADNVLVPQGKIDAILFSTNANRIKEIQRTVGLARAAEAEAALRSELSNQQLTAGLAAQLEAGLASLADNRDQLADLQARLSELNDAVEDMRPEVERYAEFSRAAELRKAVERLDAGLAEARARVPTRQSELDDCTATLDAARKLLSELEGPAAAAKEMQQAAELTRHRVAERERLTEQLEAARSSLTALPSYDEDVEALEKTVGQQSEAVRLRTAQLEGTESRPTLPQETELREHLAVLRTSLPKQRGADCQPATVEETRLMDRIAKLEEDTETFKTGRCPTCGQAVERFDPEAAEMELTELRKQLREAREAEDRRRLEAVRKHETELAETTARLDELDAAARTAIGRAKAKAEAALSEARAKLTEVRRVAEERRTTAQQIAELEGRLAELADVRPVDASKLEEAASLLNQHTSVKLQLGSLETDLTAKQRNLEEAVRALEQAEADRAAVGELADLPPPEELERLKLLCSEYAERKGEAERAAREAGVAEAKVQHYEELTASLKEQQDAEEARTRWAAVCKRAREVLHFSGLPSLMLQEYAAVLNRRMLYYHKLWEAPFTMKLDDELNFVAEFDSGYHTRASRLSGGQKIVASTAFRLAMANTFARSVDLLVLDEPSNYLDHENITHLQQLMIKLQDSAVVSQMIIVTHERALMGFFDRTIELNKPCQESHLA